MMSERKVHIRIVISASDARTRQSQQYTVSPALIKCQQLSRCCVSTRRTSQTVPPCYVRLLRQNPQFPSNCILKLQTLHFNYFVWLTHVMQPKSQMFGSSEKYHRLSTNHRLLFTPFQKHETLYPALHALFALTINAAVGGAVLVSGYACTKHNFFSPIFQYISTHRNTISHSLESYLSSLILSSINHHSQPQWTTPTSWVHSSHRSQYQKRIRAISHNVELAIQGTILEDFSQCVSLWLPFHTPLKSSMTVP